MKKKIISKLLPETRSLRRLRELGYTADMAEIRKGPFLKIDWGHFADMVAVRKGDRFHERLIPEVLFVQATGHTNVSARVKKVLAAPDAYDVVWAGCRVEVWGWEKHKENPRIVDLSDLRLYEPLPHGHPDRP